MSEDDPSLPPEPPEAKSLFTEPFLFVAAFGEFKRLPVPKQTKKTAKQVRTIKPKASLLIRPSKPDYDEIIEADGSKWKLHCTCDIKRSEGDMVYCEKCDTWQHSLCANLNSHTLPENYACSYCSSIVIRCKCGSNSNYRFRIIKCHQCGFYVHRRCENLDYGPDPPNFICSSCGRSPYVPHQVSLTLPNLSDESKMIHFDSFPTYLTNGPLGDFLRQISQTEMTLKSFCESLYAKFSSFFFLSHQLYTTTLSKKKRSHMFQTFLIATERLLHQFFGVSHADYVRIFNSLLRADLYDAGPVPAPSVYEKSLIFSENAMIESSAMQFQRVDYTRQAVVEANVTKEALRPDQFICFLDGFVADLEEFDYSPRVPTQYYQIANTRFVLDVSRVEGSPLPQMERSMEGNCVIKLFTLITGENKCGLFAGNATLDQLAPSPLIPAGQTLTLGIDFIPALIADESRWISWHVTPDPDQKAKERTKKAIKKKVDSQSTPPSPQNVIADIKKKPRKKMPIPSASPELTLFSLFEGDTLHDIILQVVPAPDENAEEESHEFVQEQIHSILQGFGPPRNAMEYHPLTVANPIQQMRDLLKGII